MGIPPLRKAIRVPCPRDRAFEVFTRGLGEWWPLATHAVHPHSAVALELSTEVGGNLFETSDDGETETWGRVRAYEPPRRVAFSWHPGMDEEMATDVSVSFDDADGATAIELIHGGWEVRGPDALAARAGYDAGWDAVLGRFVAAASDAT